MVAMAQRTSQRPDAATLSDDVTMADHVRLIRTQTSYVKDVENGRRFFDNKEMLDYKTGPALIALKNRSGLTLEAIARRAGYRGRSSVQSFFSEAYDKPLDTDVALKLCQALVGIGKPPIDRAEILQLTGMFEKNAEVVKFEGASIDRMAVDVPIVGTVLGADRVSGALSIEQTYLYDQEVIGYAKRPAILDGRADVYGCYVQGSSMDPAYEDGALIFVEGKRQPKVGEYAVIYLRMNGEDQESDGDGNARTVLIKKLTRKTAAAYQFEQFNPRLTFEIDSREVLKMHRVIPWGELLS
jgi:hypothetical protein